MFFCQIMPVVVNNAPVNRDQAVIKDSGVMNVLRRWALWISFFQQGGGSEGVLGLQSVISISAFQRREDVNDCIIGVVNWFLHG